MPSPSSPTTGPPAATATLATRPGNGHANSPCSPSSLANSTPAPTACSTRNSASRGRRARSDCSSARCARTRAAGGDKALYRGRGQRSGLDERLDRNDGKCDTKQRSARPVESAGRGWAEASAPRARARPGELRGRPGRVRALARRGTTRVRTRLEGRRRASLDSGWPCEVGGARLYRRRRRPGARGIPRNCQPTFKPSSPLRRHIQAP